MKTFITGASGYLGQKLAWKLAESGEHVQVLIRNKNIAVHLMHPNIKIFYGDILDLKSVKEALADCEVIFHVAALARVWSKNPEDFFTVNVDGTKNLIQAAKEANVKKFILTSSTGTIGPSLKKPNDENTSRWSSFNNDYELSKYLAEEEVQKEVSNGFPGLIVNPSRIFGPGLESPSSGINRLIAGYLKNRIAIMPTNHRALGNYGYIDDIVEGHIKARDKGEIGQKYILGGENKSLGELFKTIQKLSPQRGIILKFPIWPLKYWSSFELFLGDKFGRTPKITPDFVKRINQDAAFSSEKAIQNLGYKVTPFEEAIEITIQFLWHKRST
ncbi:NAD-dependent epimerase/dehydratase family protein [Aquiflexum lacus]|uniref:NAD-dependent epimerase/dehydratase family protein n=1 Tax=Aquiflexum lacus TaxID=2483805 RepID=UPI0018955373|nr:NAD-dependent epimerase/dehydratase family protein [Aquiflexum lacus]